MRQRRHRRGRRPSNGARGAQSGAAPADKRACDHCGSAEPLEHVPVEPIMERALPVYARLEVAFLLSLSERDAREHDECIASCAAGWGATATSPSAGEDTLPLGLRWRDVQLARKAALASISAEHDLVTQLRISGHTEERIAAIVGTSDSTVRRRFASTLDSIMLALGGELADDEAQPRVSLCLICGDRPRARAVTHGPKRKGQPRPRHERQLAICRVCATAAAERAGR
jgi:hypothetical protein